MKTYSVYYSQTNDLTIEVDAENLDEAKEKADEIISNRTFEKNIEQSQKGYWEYCYTDEEDEE